MIDLGPPPQLYIPARPALVRAHHGDLDALKRLERERGIKAMLPGMVPAVVAVGSVTPGLTQKGYGRVYDTGETSSITLNYANVVSGSAPAAGDLVVWIVGTIDTGGSPIVSRTGSGWQQSITSAGPTFHASVLAKQVSSGDISSPETIVVSPEYGSIAFWVAYAVTGSISALSVASVSAGYSGVSTPSSQTANSSALEAPDVGIAIGMGGGSDNSPSLAMSGGTPDINFQSANDQYYGDVEARFMVNATVGGANIGFSMSDDGYNNSMASSYVSVEFA